MADLSVAEDRLEATAPRRAGRLSRPFHAFAAALAAEGERRMLWLPVCFGGGRWLDYARTGHGGNMGLKSRDPSDYQVSVLEVAGSGSSIEDILRMEQLWKMKLRSLEMGLNRN